MRKALPYSSAFLPWIAAVPRTASAAAAVTPRRTTTTTTWLRIVVDIDVVGMVAGQETYGFFAIVIGEALWSFLQAPPFDHSKVLIPAMIASGILIAIAGPTVTSGDATSVTLGLKITTGTSIFLGTSYVIRILAPYLPSPKEISFLGLLLSAAGFFRFLQNLLTNEFVALPSQPGIEMPKLLFNVPKSFEPIDWYAINVIREEAKRNDMAVANAAAVVVGAEDYAVVAREVAAATTATVMVTVDASATAMTSTGEAAAAIVSQ